MRLAERLRCTLDELRDRVTYDELALWVAFAEVDGPWWGVRGDYRAAAVARYVMAGAGVKDPGPVEDYLIRWAGNAPASAPNLLPYVDGIAALAAMSGRSSG